MMLRRLGLVLLLGCCGTRAPAQVPVGIVRQLPAGMDILGNATLSAGGHMFVIVAIGLPDEKVFSPHPAQARPLLIFARGAGGAFRLLARNDTVVLRADGGGQCDPFLDGGGVIAAQGRFFTVQNGVACGQHWTDYITFRFDDGLGTFVFDNERYESWSLNPNQDPGAEAIVRDGPPHVKRARRGRPVLLSRWRPTS